jgi:hypothetical protein
MLLVLFVNVKTGDNKHKDEAGEGVDQTSNATAVGNYNQNRALYLIAGQVSLGVASEAPTN